MLCSDKCYTVQKSRQRVKTHHSDYAGAECGRGGGGGEHGAGAASRGSSHGNSCIDIGNKWMGIKVEKGWVG